MSTLNDRRSHEQILIIIVRVVLVRTIEQHLENLDQIRMRPTHNTSVQGSMARTTILQREVKSFHDEHFQHDVFGVISCMIKIVSGK